MTTVRAQRTAVEPQAEMVRAERRAAADRVRALRALQLEMDAQWRIALDLIAARSRIREGRTGYQPLEVIASAGDLIVPFMRATKAIETAGLASYEAIASARERRFEVLHAVSAWVAGERCPRDPALQVVHLGASLVAGSILRRTSQEIVRELPLDAWMPAHCPCCGGTPDVAVHAGSARRLLCARCDTVWSSRHGGCLGCGAQAAPALARIAAPAIGYALLICNACGRYLKERRDGETIDPLVERSLTAELDAAAEGRGLRG